MPYLGLSKKQPLVLPFVFGVLCCGWGGALGAVSFYVRGSMADYKVLTQLASGNKLDKDLYKDPGR